MNNNLQRDFKFLESRYNEARKFFENNKLIPAIECIESLANGVTNWELKSQFESLKNSYKMMLDYMCKGFVDPKRNEVWHDLMTQFEEVADKLYLQAKAEDHITLFSSTYKYSRKEAIAKDGFAEEFSFNAIWTSDIWNNDTLTKAETYLLTSHHINQSLFVSALTMAILEVFDIRKLSLLFQAYKQADNLGVRMRAVVGILIAATIYNERLNKNEEFKNLLKLTPAEFAKDIATAQIQLFISKNTQQTKKKMMTEIFPDLIKNSDYLAKLHDDEDDLLAGSNPEWEKKKEEINSHIMELSKMQQDGLDIYYGTFASVKNFEFFNHIENWFKVFDPSHPDIASIITDEKGNVNSIIDIAIKSNTFCDSDSYSLCYMMKTFPSEHRKYLFQQFDGQAIPNNNEVNGDTRNIETPESSCRHYVQDLYRFFYVFPLRHQFINIFSKEQNLSSCSPLYEIIKGKREEIEIAEFLLDKEFFVDAIDYLQSILQTTDRQGEILEKLGYANQKLGNWQSAIDYYEKASIITPGSQWIYSHIAFCYLCLRKCDKAISYYKQLDDVEENPNIIMRIADCYRMKNDNENALSLFFKAEYLSKDSLNPKRGIAWCAMLENKLDTAKKYYDKILNSNCGNKEDYMNAGYCYTAIGIFKTAYELFTKSLKLYEEEGLTIDSWLDIFDKDVAHFNDFRIDTKDFGLMRDAIKLAPLD